MTTTVNQSKKPPTFHLLPPRIAPLLLYSTRRYDLCALEEEPEEDSNSDLSPPPTPLDTAQALHPVPTAIESIQLGRRSNCPPSPLHPPAPLFAASGVIIVFL